MISFSIIIGQDESSVFIRPDSTVHAVDVPFELVLSYVREEELRAQGA